MDKTSREILFLPLPPDLKYRAKPFIDVTMDRVAKGLGALLILVLIKDWGLGLTWRQLSYASLTMMVLWVFFAMRARKEYLAAFRQSIEQQDVEAGGDPARHRRPQHHRDAGDRAVAPRTAARDLCDGSAGVAGQASPGDAAPAAPRGSRRCARGRWQSPKRRVPTRRRTGCAASCAALKDANASVRLAAVRALAALKREEATELMRPICPIPIRSWW